MPTLADVLRQTGYAQDGTLIAPTTNSPMTSALSEHIKTLPQQLATNQAALDSAIGSWNKIDFGTGQSNPNYRPEAMQELTQLMPNMAGIISPKAVNQMGMVTTLPKDDIFSQAVANTPNARITDEGLYINLMRKQKPEQAMTESVRSGVFYLPEGSANIKHYGGSNSYGGTEKITGETLYKNPLFVKGATGGKAPENAYLQLTDPNELRKMQTDAQKVGSYLYTGRPGQEANKAIEVQSFLEKYAPDLVDYADYIVSNSSRGNQLKYALQEAAVAQKVRDAGYDAVIGHSKGKQGPFISEIFDIRESHYPDKFGNFELNPKFEEMTRKQILEQELKKRVE